MALTYHRINDGEEDRPISVSLRNFEQQIAYLKKKVDILSVDDLISRLSNIGKIEKDAVVITFDDGYRDNYLNAYPILKRYNIPPVIFITTGLIDNNPIMLNTNDILQMRKEGLIAFGAHTVSHKLLLEVDRETAISEINGSRAELEKLLKQEIKYFAYPYGKKGQDFNDETVEIVKNAGFIAAFSTNNGCISDKSNIFALERIGIRDFPLFVFKVRLSGIFESKAFSILRKYFNLT